MTTMSTKTEFLIPDMTCGHCVKAITAAVQRVSPGAVVQAQVDAHRVAIQAAADTAAIEAAIRAEGYHPEALAGA
jgi:copper chaperone